MTKKMLLLDRTGPAILWLCLMGVFLLDHLVQAGLIVLGGLRYPLQVSGMLLPAIGAFGLFALSLYTVLFPYQQALRFGRTRRGTLVRLAALLLAEAAVTWGLCALLTWLEHRFSLPLWMDLSGATGYELTFNSGEFHLGGGPDPLYITRLALPWWAPPSALAAGTLAALFPGALILRFGRRGIWALWILWMAFFLLGPSFLPYHRLAGLPWLLPVLALLLLGLALWSVWSLLHAVVRP